MITVSRSVYIPWDRIDESVTIGSVSYLAPDSDAMVEVVSLPGDTFLRRSEDNGETWERWGEWDSRGELPDGTVTSRGMMGIYMDPATGGLIRGCLEGVVHSTPDGVVHWFPAATTYKIFFQYSQDQGETWSEFEQLIIAGGEFNETHWAPDVTYGENGGVAMLDSTFTRSDGTIVMPFTMWRVPDEGEKRYLGEFAYLILHDEEHGAWERQDATLLGRWREDGSGMDWDISNYVRVDRRHSVDGACEPGVCQLPDGRLFMIIRTRIFPDSDVETPGTKFYAVSEDGGRTWTDGQMLRYDDRGGAYAPASFSRVFVSSKNGRLYVITNLTDLPCYGCDPRTKLQIAEIDLDTLRVIRDSVTTIEQWHEGQQESIRFSNFAWQEDRQTGNMILYMTPAPGPTGTWAEGDVKDTPRSLDVQVPPHAYRYEIVLPE